jgi:hypothetical protein
VSEKPLEAVVYGKTRYERYPAREPVTTRGGLTLGDTEITSWYPTGENVYRFWGLTSDEFAQRIAESRSLAESTAAAMARKRGTKRDDEWWDAYEQGRMDGMLGKNQRRQP